MCFASGSDSRFELICQTCKWGILEEFGMSSRFIEIATLIITSISGVNLAKIVNEIFPIVLELDVRQIRDPESVNRRNGQ